MRQSLLESKRLRRSEWEKNEKRLHFYFTLRIESYADTKSCHAQL
jgi:hypothetical protein